MTRLVLLVWWAGVGLGTVRAETAVPPVKAWQETYQQERQKPDYHREDIPEPPPSWSEWLRTWLEELFSPPGTDPVWHEAGQWSPLVLAGLLLAGMTAIGWRVVIRSHPGSHFPPAPEKIPGEIPAPAAAVAGPWREEVRALWRQLEADLCASGVGLDSSHTARQVAGRAADAFGGDWLTLAVQMEALVYAPRPPTETEWRAFTRQSSQLRQRLEGPRP